MGVKIVHAALAVALGVALQMGVRAEPVTAERIAALPVAERPAWTVYMERSAKLLAADHAALAAEVKGQGLAAARRAPNGGDFRNSHKPGDAWYASEEAKALAATIISYQTPMGGWSKHLGYSTGARRPGTQWGSQNEPAEAWHYICTFDNGATTGEIGYLAEVWKATGEEECKRAAQRGIDFVLAAQYPNGGWPQVFPLEGKYHDDITYNDDAMTHLLELLHGITAGAPVFEFVDAAQRKAAALAYERAMQCVLATQYVQNGKRSAWCQQYDAVTLKPSSARLKEPVALASAETANVLKFIMELPEQTPAVQESIEGALAWLEQVKISDMAETQINGKKGYVKDPANAVVRWARFYSLDANKPLFAGATDGIVYETYNEMASKNRVGYDYYTTRPESVVTTRMKKWRKLLAGGAVSKQPTARGAKTSD